MIYNNSKRCEVYVTLPRLLSSERCSASLTCIVSASCWENSELALMEMPLSEPFKAILMDAPAGSLSILSDVAGSLKMWRLDATSDSGRLTASFFLGTASSSSRGCSCCWQGSHGSHGSHWSHGSDLSEMGDSISHILVARCDVATTALQYSGSKLKPSSASSNQRRHLDWIYLIVPPAGLCLLPPPPPPPPPPLLLLLLLPPPPQTKAPWYQSDAGSDDWWCDRLGP